MSYCDDNGGDSSSAKHGGDSQIPADACFACAYGLWVQVDSFVEAAYFRRTEVEDELWVGTTEVLLVCDYDLETLCADDFAPAKLVNVKHVCSSPRQGDQSTACLRLLGSHLRAQVGFAWPECFLVAGIVDRPSFENLVAQIKQEIDETEHQARLLGDAPILAAAQDLGCSPQPTGRSSTGWYMSCPGRNHVVFLDAKSNTFTCPWCKRKGGVEELKAFVQERRSRWAKTTPDEN
ncbi:MAG: hypothetical protein N3B14_08560 [Thermoleophilia bacterium]|nr:hypothetical protein [Thermoleophilia bacterium]